MKKEEPISTLSQVFLIHFQTTAPAFVMPRKTWLFKVDLLSSKVESKEENSITFSHLGYSI